MHIQKNIAHWFAWVLIAYILISIINKPIVVEASTPNISASKIYDIALTKTGIVANKSTIDGVINQTINTIEGTAQSYYQWCEDNGKEKNATTWQEYLESDAYSSLPFRLSAWALRSADIINYIITGESLTDELRDMLPSAITGKSLVDIAKGFTLPSDVVEDIREEFENYIMEYGDYFYVKTMTSDELNPLWFGSVTSYEAVKSFVDTLPYVAHLIMYTGGQYDMYTQGADNTYEATNIEFWLYEEQHKFLGHTDTSGYVYHIIDVYDTDWGNPDVYKGLNPPSYYKPYEEMISQLSLSTNKKEPKMKIFGSNGNPTLEVGLVSADGRYVKVFKNENALKLSVLGQDAYYITDNSNDYITNNDNSVNVTEEYIVNNSGTYSHDIIQETINNTENITQDTVNNIVNTSSTTIINNYGQSSDGSGEGDDSEAGDGNGILDGLGSVIEGFAEILGFLLKAIGEILGLIGNLFNTIFEGIKSLGSIFAGFSGLLGELFPFIPTELMTFVSIAIEATIAIAVWKHFKK